MFRSRAAFWLGCAAVSIGVMLHIPMFLMGRKTHYVLAGMPMGPWMIFGMFLILAGFALTYWGLVPNAKTSTLPRRRVRVEAMDETRIGKAHVLLMAVLTVAIAIDTLKPFTFTFILPGVAKEYGLRSPLHPLLHAQAVALYPFWGIVGTALGSFIWGFLGDRIGRRASILLAAVVFIGTSICGAMPSFGWNEFMCFVMGLGAGGLLPIAYSLMTEVIPARRRGQIVVLVAGIGTAVGFLMTGWCADWLMPHFGWRIMWFIGFPTGLLLIVLNRWLPESPRFLIECGRHDEAEAIMKEFGAKIASDEPSAPTEAIPAHSLRGFVPLFRHPYTLLTLALVLYGLAWGLVDFGFLVWLPANLSTVGLDPRTVTPILAKASLLAVPGAIVTAWMYGRSSRFTMIFFAALTFVVLGAFALFGDRLASSRALLTTLLVILLVALWGVISVLAPYSAEVYPTLLRGGGSGLTAGASKLGGVLVLGMAAASVAPPGVAGSALLGAIPMALAALAVGSVGMETSGRGLEEIERALPVPE